MTERAGPPLPLSPAADRSVLPRWARRLLPWVLFGAGLLVALLLAQTLGEQQVRAALWSLASTLPAVASLEVMRFLAELQSTRELLPIRVPWPALLQAQCAAHVCGQVMPAGRTAGEGIKTAILSPHMGAIHAGAVGAAGQLITFIVNGSLSLLAALVTILDGSTPELALALCLFGSALLGVGAILTLALRRGRTPVRLRSWPVADTLLERVAEAARHGARFGPGAVLWQAVARLMQAAQLGILLGALSPAASASLSLIALGVHLVGAAAGDFLPAHMGTTEGAFALSASVLHIAPSAALSLALVLHAVQLAFTGLTLLSAVLLRLLRARHRP